MNAFDVSTLACDNAITCNVAAQASGIPCRCYIKASICFKHASFGIRQVEYQKAHLKPGLPTSGKDLKHCLRTCFLSLPDMAWSSYRCNDGIDQ